MRDFARSDDAAVQRQLDRLAGLSVPEGRLGLDTIRALLDRLDNPQRRLPPAFHVAGTNGKGSTCAFLRAMLEAQGYRVHVTTSPHLVRYNERIRLAGELISDARLAEILAEVLDAGADLDPSFFEVTIAAAFLEFARVPADACVVEVGLGGRFDATNVLPPHVLAACGIASLGIDHERFLLAPEPGTPEDPLARIAFEKAGIAKAGVPLVTLAYPDIASVEVEWMARRSNVASLAIAGREWDWLATDEMLVYRDDTARNGADVLHLPRPSMRGLHQMSNAALAVAILRHQKRIQVSSDAMALGLQLANWPGRLQRLATGPVAREREVWIDGGHNPDAGAMLARHFAGRQVHLVIGMLANKNPAALTGPMRPSLATVTAVPVPGHEWHPAAAFGSDVAQADDVAAALRAIPSDGLPVLIAGSLYLAGEVLRQNAEPPA